MTGKCVSRDPRPSCRRVYKSHLLPFSLPSSPPHPLSPSSLFRNCPLLQPRKFYLMGVSVKRSTPPYSIPPYLEVTTCRAKGYSAWARCRFHWASNDSNQSSALWKPEVGMARQPCAECAEALRESGRCEECDIVIVPPSWQFPYDFWLCVGQLHCPVVGYQPDLTLAVSGVRGFVGETPDTLLG